MSAPRQSRYHVYRTSSTKTLLIADSQARNLKAGNLNILSLPGACVRHVYNFIPPKDIFDIIILFVGGNDLYFSKNPTTTPALQVAHEITDLANLLCDRAKVVYVLGIPERNENKVRSKQVNDFLQSVESARPKTSPSLRGGFELWPDISLGPVIFIPTTPHTSTKTVSITLEILLKKKSYTKPTKRS